MGMKSFYPKGNWVKRKSRIKESVESLIKWVFEKTVNKSWQNRWDSSYIPLLTMILSPFGRRFIRRLKGLLASLAFSSSLFVHAGIKCYNHVERNVYRLQGP